MELTTEQPTTPATPTVQLFTEAELVSFGEFLLTKHTKQRHPAVSHGDYMNWLEQQALSIAPLSEVETVSPAY